MACRDRRRNGRCPGARTCRRTRRGRVRETCPIAAPRDKPCRCDAGDPAWLFYTSGTTGRPKGVVITHGNLRAMSQCFLTDVEAVAPGDAILHVAPLSHGSGLYVLPHVLAGAVNVVPASGGFDPAEIVALIGTWDRASFFAAPTMVKRLVRAPVLGRRCASIASRASSTAAARCTSPTANEACAALGPRLAQIYGQGESPMTITAMNRASLADAFARDDVCAHRIGRRGAERVSTSSSQIPATCRCLPGELGEVLVRGPTVMAGYWRNPEASASTLANGLAAYRRRRLIRRRRVPHVEGPVEGSHHQRRLEHLPARSRGSAPAVAPGRRRSRR